MTASLLIPPKARFFTASGVPLSGGKVYSYVAGTLTEQSTYTTYQGNVANTNPVILDSAGEANIWLNGSYKLKLTDSNDVEQWTVDNITSITNSNNFYTTTGSANNYILTPSPASLAYNAGDVYYVVFNVANSGPSTINISGLGTKSLVIPPSTALSSGNLLTSIVYQIIYDGTNFQVLNYTTVTSSPPILIQMGFSSTAPSGYIVLNGSTIGSASSGATYAGSTYSTLYAYLWNNVNNTYAPVSGGRGANAAADFSANKALTMPDCRDRSPYGVGSLLTSAAATGGATTVTSTGTISVTVSSHTLTSSEIPAVSVTLSPSIETYSTEYAGASSPGVRPSTGSGSLISGTTAGSGGGHSHSASGGYSGNATSVIHPVFGIYYYINY